jgi:pantoate--beta-alanine ligase
MRELFPIVSHLAEMRRLSREVRTHGKTIALVPTMGYLHAGHVSLIQLANQHSDSVVVSIFVNPSQFNNRDDFEKYPIDREHDCAILAREHVHSVFTPSADEIYPAGFETWIEVGALAAGLEGAHRPGHFRGVATIVAKLLNIVEPDFAVFGEKDFQQLRVIEQMVTDLNIPVRIVRAPIIREQDGLAMSSRNVRLQPEARKSAIKLSEALHVIVDSFSKGDNLCWSLKEKAAKVINQEPDISLDYIEIVDEQSLTPLHSATEVSHPRALIAAHVAGVRLIDNMSLITEGKAA